MILKLIKGSSKSLNIIQIACRKLNSKIPKSPVPTLANKHAPPVIVERNTIALLERLSLVSYDTEEGVKILEDSIAFADTVLHINTDDVQPLYSVLEDQHLTLREDKITEGNCQKEILKNAMLKEDDYFVAPIGNIPLHEVEIVQESTKVTLKEPSQLLIKNIHANWMQYNYTKSNNYQMPIYMNELNLKSGNIPSVFGIMKHDLQVYDEKTALELQFSNSYPLHKSFLQLHLVVPKPEAMHYLIKWQRYRKYWWSSISTTPSLFSVKELKYENNSANVDIVALFPSGEQPVEHLSFRAAENARSCRLTCSMCLEDALFILLLDGRNSTDEEYLRLHRKIAPFKISFAVDVQEQSTNGALLRNLATLLYFKLKMKKVSAWLPDFSLPLDLQIKENFEIGATYTGILDDETLKFGIFKLMSSSTKLMEHVHVADFCNYAAVIFDKET